MKVLNEFMAGLSAGDAVEFYRLKIMPIFVDEDRHLPYMVLEEALKGFRGDYRDIGRGEDLPLGISPTAPRFLIFV